MKTKEIWVTHARYEKNADDGIRYYTSKQALADGVMAEETCGGKVQVYKCVPVNHSAYTERAGIDIMEEDDT